MIVLAPGNSQPAVVLFAGPEALPGPACRISAQNYRKSARMLCGFWLAIDRDWVANCCCT